MTYVNTSHCDLLATQAGSHTRSFRKYKSAKYCCPTSIKSLIGSKFYSMRSVLKNRLITVKIHLTPPHPKKKSEAGFKGFLFGQCLEKCTSRCLQ